MSEEVSNTIKGGVKQFTDNLSNSKSFKKFKNRATKFGKTGKFNVKDFFFNFYLIKCIFVNKSKDKILLIENERE